MADVIGKGKIKSDKSDGNKPRQEGQGEELPIEIRKPQLALKIY